MGDEGRTGGSRLANRFLPARFLLAMATVANAKLTVGIEMLRDARIGEFDAAKATLSKILGNIVANPQEPKYRKLRQSNAKIAELLATRGVRAILTGVGFVQDGDFLCLPDEA